MSIEQASRPVAGGGSRFGFRMVVSPAHGRIRRFPPARFDGGDEWVSEGQVLAVIEQGTTVAEVRAPLEAQLAGMLVSEGEPVVAGQPVAWLVEPDAAWPVRRRRTSSR